MNNWAHPNMLHQKFLKIKLIKIDIWAVGVVLYNMVKGTQPFSDKDIENVKEQVLHKEINYNGFRNNELKSLCEELLERDPNKRLTAFQAINQLKIIQSGNRGLKRQNTFIYSD